VKAGFIATRDSFRLVIKSKVKVTLVQELRLCTGRTANRGE